MIERPNIPTKRSAVSYQLSAKEKSSRGYPSGLLQVWAIHLVSVHPESLGGHKRVSDAEMSNFPQVQGNQEIARRRTHVRRN
jgi:hypothetical protein